MGKSYYGGLFASVDPLEVWVLLPYGPLTLAIGCITNYAPLSAYKLHMWQTFFFFLLRIIFAQCSVYRVFQ